MHIINECPRCGKDFMYHQTDAHLVRQITLIDEVGNNEIVNTVICQECDEIEHAVKCMREAASEHDWLWAVIDSIDKYGIQLTIDASRFLLEAEADLLKTKSSTPME